jgi:hypothetical protein
MISCITYVLFRVKGIFLRLLQDNGVSNLSYTVYILFFVSTRVRLIHASAHFPTLSISFTDQP